MQKTLLFAFALMITFGGIHAQAKDILNEKQKDTTLELLNNLCGDTWCEGDFEYEFDQIDCSKHKKNCKIELNVLIYGEFCYSNKPNEIKLYKKISWLCRIPSLNKVSDILVREKKKEVYLNQRFIDKADQCIGYASEPFWSIYGGENFPRVGCD